MNEKWEGNYDNFLLYALANKSLYLTIEKIIGRDIFQIALGDYIQMKHSAQEICTNETIFSCSKDGEYQTLSESHCYKGTMV